MDSIKHFFQMLAAWKFWHDTFHGFIWLDWFLLVAVLVAVMIGIYRGFGYFFSRLVYVFLMALSVGLIFPWLADAAIRYLSFAKAGFWNPVCFIACVAGAAYLFKKLAALRSKKTVPTIHPFWDRVIGAVSGFFLVLLAVSFVSQFFLLLPSKSVRSLYGSRGAKYGPVLKNFAPQVVVSALAPVRLIVNRK